MPWLLGWLIALARYADNRKPYALFVAVLCLGMAVYGYLGTAVIAPFYFAGTIAFLYFSLRERTLGPYVALAAGALISMCLLVYWHILHPERWNEFANSN